MTTQRLLTIALLLAASNVPVFAEDSAEAWFERMSERASRGHYKVNTNAEMAIQQQGIASTMQMSGTTNFVSKERFRINLDMSLSMQGMDVTVSMLTVSDGENFWLVTDSPLTGGKQVMTGKTADLDRYAELGQANLSGVGGIGSDPASEIRQIVEKFDMQVTSREDGRVTLHADVTAEDAKAADLGPFAESMSYITLVLDEEQAMPLSLLIGGATPIMKMDFTDYVFFDPAQIVDSDYAYTPPEGVQINDLGQMLQ